MSAPSLAILDATSDHHLCHTSRALHPPPPPRPPMPEDTPYFQMPACKSSQDIQPDCQDLLQHNLCCLSKDLSKDATASPISSYFARWQSIRELSCFVAGICEVILQCSPASSCIQEQAIAAIFCLLTSCLPMSVWLSLNIAFCHPMMLRL